MSQRDSDAPDVARSFRLAQECLLEFKQNIARQRFYLEEAMDLNQELNDASDKLQKSIDDAQAAVQKHSDDQAQIIADLKAQVAAGLTPTQASALLTKLQGSQKDIQETADALAVVATDPAVPTTPVPTPPSGGETGVPIGGSNG